MLFPYFGRRPKTGIQNLSDKETGCIRPCLQNMGSPDIFKGDRDESAPARSPHEQDEPTEFGS